MKIKNISFDDIDFDKIILSTPQFIVNNNIVKIQDIPCILLEINFFEKSIKVLNGENVINYYYDTGIWSETSFNKGFREMYIGFQNNLLKKKYLVCT